MEEYDQQRRFPWVPPSGEVFPECTTTQKLEGDFTVRVARDERRLLPGVRPWAECCFSDYKRL